MTEPATERPVAWQAAKPNLVAAYPEHVPMGLPMPPRPAPPAPADRPDAEYVL